MSALAWGAGKTNLLNRQRQEALDLGRWCWVVKGLTCNIVFGDYGNNYCQLARGSGEGEMGY